MVKDASDYLWKTPENYRRLDKEFPNYVGFLREKVAKCPDMTLRVMYRKAVIEEQQKVG